MAKKNWLALGLTPIVALGLIAGVACGGDDDDDSNGGGSTPEVTQPAQNGGSNNSGNSGDATNEIPEGAPVIDQDNLKFEPTKLTVKSGEKVYFLNSETAIHTVTINGNNESGNMRRGDVFVWTAGDPGEYQVTCEFHPQMKATITVE